MNNWIWKATLGDDIPALVIGRGAFALVIWTWPRWSVTTKAAAVARMGSIRPR